MCGIIGILTNTSNCIGSLINGLKKLQNRGYDSAGICTINDNNFILHKYASESNSSALNKLENITDYHVKSMIGIAHTRWATHGEKSDINSHPHISSDNKIAIVHNGIIENFGSLKEMLISEGYIFKSQTDSEIVANLLSYNYKKFNNSIVSITETIKLLKGTWGLAIMFLDKPNELYCTRNGSPLLIGQTEDYVIVTSEQSGFTKEIIDYIVLKNLDICIIRKDDNAEINIETKHNYVSKKVTQTQQDIITPEPYLYWTIKEIYEQSESSLRAISFGGRVISNSEVKLGGLEDKKDILLKTKNIILLGCGTSYNAGMIGMYYFKDLCNFNSVQLFDGADFNVNDIPKIGETTLILLSQSGETKDLHRCIQIARENKLATIGIINVVDSLIAREVDCGCYLNAGKEVAVASTKSFTSQCIMLSLVSIWFSQNHNINLEKRINYIKDLYNLNLQINDLLSNLETKIQQILYLFNDQNSCFILGKGMNEAVAREGSLKIKEISYIHSESYSTSSLKHGPFALLCDKFPVILVMPNDEHFTKNENAYHEIKSRKASIITITNKYMKEVENVIYIPANNTYSNILSVIPLQMLAYKLSLSKGINPDMPKNLAKVVTVE